MTRSRGRREPVAARADPGLGRVRLGRAGDAVDGDPPAGLDALLGGLNPEQLRGGHPRRRAAARRRRRGDRQDPGHHAADRVADRDPPGAAVGDPRADVHGEGRGGDAGPGRPARPVRLHGRDDRDVPRVRRPADPRVRAGARPADGRPRPDPAGGRDLPARAPVRVRARRVPAARRPDAVPRRARDAVQPLQGRGRLAGGVPRPRGRARGRGRARSRTTRRSPRRRGARASWPAAYARYQELLAANGFIDFGDQVEPRAAARPDVGGGPGGAPGRGSGTSSSTSSRTRTGPSRSSSRSSPSRTGTSRSSATTTSRSTGSGARRSATSSTSATATARPGRSSCAATTARCAPILDAVLPARPVQRSGPARGPGRRSRSGSAPDARRPPTSAPVRLERIRDARRGGGLDRRRDRPADRGRGAARATTPSSSGRTATPTRSCAASTRPASRGGSPGTSGLYARPEVRRLLAFLRAVADLGSSVDVYARRDRRAVPPRRRGPDGDREHGPAPPPERLGGPRGARAPAGHPARVGGDPDAASRRLVGGPAALHRARPRAAGGRGALRVPAGRRDASAGSRRATRSRPRRQLRNIARFFDIVRGPVGAARRRPGGVRRPPPRRR